jgi:hypothetical protein
VEFVFAFAFAFALALALVLALALELEDAGECKAAQLISAQLSSSLI